VPVAFNEKVLILGSSRSAQGFVFLSTHIAKNCDAPP
jgi:hypothetical protein